MKFSRRSFAGSALSAAIATNLPSRLLANSAAQSTQAMAAIRSFAEADLAFNFLPGMTLGVVAADGQRTTMNFGHANRDTGAPITTQTLFQIGSITKSMVAIVIHQLVREGRIRLSDRLASLLPGLPFSSTNEIEVQHLLDHVAGLADDPPVFAPGGLWTAYAPGTHWHYSNAGYEILGKIIEAVSAMPLSKVIGARILGPLGMRQSRGAIVYSDRLLYAQGYEPADRAAAYWRGEPLAPAPWVDMTAAAGCVASTADEMLSYLSALAAAARGAAALGLSAQQARLLTTHSVRSDTPGMSYGNGLMHVTADGGSYLHHTGGMLAFSSSFHVDPATGVGAFASSSLSAFADYRPRLLTRFAVDVLASEALGRAIPAPPPLGLALPNAASYVGRYSGPSGSFEIRAGSPLMIIAGGRSAPLIPVAEDIFRSSHPSFQLYSFLIERRQGAVVLANWGGNAYVREDAGALPLAASDPAVARLAGRYVNDDPWYGPMPVVERGGRLWIGTEIPMTRISENLWRVGREQWSPERGSFGDFLAGKPQSFFFSGVKFERHDI